MISDITSVLLNCQHAYSQCREICLWLLNTMRCDVEKAGKTTPINTRSSKAMVTVTERTSQRLSS